MVVVPFIVLRKEELKDLSLLHRWVRCIRFPSPYLCGNDRTRKIKLLFTQGRCLLLDAN